MYIFVTIWKYCIHKSFLRLPYVDFKPPEISIFIVKNFNKFETIINLLLNLQVTAQWAPVQTKKNSKAAEG